MRTHAKFGALALSVIALAGGACGGSKSTSGGGAKPAPTPLATPANATVHIINDAKTVGAFDPPTSEVKAGDVVEFLNDSEAVHNVNFDNPAIADSEVIPKGKLFKATFPKAGTYTYACTIHPTMKATIAVA